MSEHIDLSALSAPEIRAGIIRGDYSAREVADSAFARIEALDDGVHAFNQATPELAYAAADRSTTWCEAARAPTSCRL